MRFLPQLPNLHGAIATDVSAGIRASEHQSTHCCILGTHGSHHCTHFSKNIIYHWTYSQPLCPTSLCCASKTSAWSVVALTMTRLSACRLQAAWLVYGRVRAYAMSQLEEHCDANIGKELQLEYTVGATCLHFCRGATEKRRKIHLHGLLHVAVIRICTEQYLNVNRSGYLFSLAVEMAERQYCLDVFCSLVIVTCQYAGPHPTCQKSHQARRITVDWETVYSSPGEETKFVIGADWLNDWSLTIYQNQSDAEVLVQDIYGHICCTESQFCTLVACLNLLFWVYEELEITSWLT